MKTNSARALGTNAKAGHVWDNFSSQTYKELSPVDELEFYNPFDEAQPIKFRPKERKTGPVTTAFLHSLVSGVPRRSCTTIRSANFTGDPSVEGRLRAFNDAAEKLLWPEKRLGKASIWRTENECYLHLRKEFVPKAAADVGGQGWLRKNRTDPQRHTSQSHRQSRARSRRDGRVAAESLRML